MSHTSVGSHRHSCWQSNDSLVDVLNLVQQGVHAGLGGRVACGLTGEVSDEERQLVPVQLPSSAHQPAGTHQAE